MPTAQTPTALVKDGSLQSVSARSTAQHCISLESQRVKLVHSSPSQANEITGSSADIA